MANYISNRSSLFQQESEKKADLISILFDPLVHNNISGMQKMNELKTQILHKLAKNPMGVFH